MCILESVSKISEFMRREQSMEKEKGKIYDVVDQVKLKMKVERFIFQYLIV